MDFPHGVTVWRLPFVAGATDAYGNPTDAWGTEQPIPGCAFDPGGSQEPFQAGRDAVVSSPRVFLPSGTVVTAQDRFTINGLTFTVQGDPAAWRNPFTGTDFPVEVVLERVSG